MNNQILESVSFLIRLAFLSLIQVILFLLAKVSCYDPAKIILKKFRNLMDQQGRQERTAQQYKEEVGYRVSIG